MIFKDILGFYKLLGVSPSASQADIKNAYKIKFNELHAASKLGKNGASDFQAVEAAYAVLSY